MVEQHLIQICSIVKKDSAEQFCSDIYYNNIRLSGLFEIELTLLFLNEMNHQLVIEVYKPINYDNLNQLV